MEFKVGQIVINHVGNLYRVTKVDQDNQEVKLQNDVEGLTESFENMGDYVEVTYEDLFGITSKIISDTVSYLKNKIKQIEDGYKKDNGEVEYEAMERIELGRLDGLLEALEVIQNNGQSVDRYRVDQKD